MSYDTIIRHGTVIDGTGAARYPADVGIVGDRIAAIGDLSGSEAAAVIEASGKIVAPGFVDVHNHSDAWLLKIPHLLPKTTQGFTTEILMADGIAYAPVNRHTALPWIYYLRALNGLRLDEYRGWESIGDYMALLDGHTAQNVMTHVAYANVRTLCAGFDPQPPDDYQMRAIQAEIARGMEEGAVGLSTGLDYIVQCFATTDELAEASRAMASAGGLYVSHVRYKKGTLEGVREAVEIGRRAGVAVHISHLKGESEAEAEAILDYIDRVAVNEVDFSFDVYPYLPSSTLLNYLLPYEVWHDGPLAVIDRLKQPQVRAHFGQSLRSLPLARIVIAWVPGRHNAPHQGKTLAEYVAMVGRPAEDALADLLIEEGLAVLLVFQRGDDALVEPFLRHDRFMIGSDGIYFPDGHVHPRVYGSATRLLGPCVREKKLFSLEEAIWKLAGFPARRFGLTDRGQIGEGKFADVVVFDAETVRDCATFDDPHCYSVGIEHVLVNGVPILSAGQPVDLGSGSLPGRYLRYRR